MTEFSTALPLHKGGKARIIAVASAQRSKLAPDIPTFIEGGVKGFTAQSYIGILAPAKTPADIIAQLQKAIAGRAQAGRAGADKLREHGLGNRHAGTDDVERLCRLHQHRLRAHARSRQARRHHAEMSGALPRGACDCHCHVFGPAARFPYAEPRSYTPDDAPLEAYLALLDRLGFDRGVLVQPSAYGRDNRAMLDALDARAEAPARRRGRRRRADAATLKQWHAAGVRGLRANEFRRDGKPYYQNGVRLAEIEPLFPRDRRSRLASAIVDRCARSAGLLPRARARAGAGGGRSHGPHGASSRHRPSRLSGAAARRRRRQIVGEAFRHLSARRDAAGLLRGEAVPRRAGRRQSATIWSGAPTGRIRGRKGRCRMRNTCSTCSWIGRRAKPIAWRSSAPTLQGFTISVEVSRRRPPRRRRRPLRPDRPALNLGGGRRPGKTQCRKTRCRKTPCRKTQGPQNPMSGGGVRPGQQDRVEDAPLPARAGRFGQPRHGRPAGRRARRAWLARRAGSPASRCWPSGTARAPCTPLNWPPTGRWPARRCCPPGPGRARRS